MGRFTPAYTGQLGAYVALVDDRLRDASIHAPTVGILLCKDRDEQVVRYALAGAPSPMAVATYTYDTFPAEQRAGLPDPARLAADLGTELTDTTDDPTVGITAGTMPPASAGQSAPAPAREDT
ncbi:PDDEXK nuclease domain-containing protein [Kineococcus sp. SYSU DK005]|uniref:PDDEXK nuclease domain-containing protein n=1 Tax=Kineococcus sp. SYSU DK005 TaxID=3383126 RepID=UPI003D7D75C8